MEDHTRWILVSMAVASIVTTVALLVYFTAQMRKLPHCPAYTTTVYT